ncbi:MAG: flagellar motor switch protein FliM [Desulforhopalus sp.]|jgi:flagellar motor switch protein FliM
MEPILNRAEIADLLRNIHDGQVSMELDGEQDNFLACTPVNLFQLARPDREQFRIPNFDIILDSFCRQYATSLTNQLQRTFSITRVSLETFEFQKFMADKSQPGAIGILDLPPLKQGALIIYDPKLSFTMLEIMLGASSDIETLELERQLTTIELNILRTPMDDACSDLDKAFAQLLDVKSRLMKLENNPRLVSIVEPEGEVIVGTLLVKSGQYSGEIHLVFPFATLEPLRELLKELLSISTQTKSSWHEIIEEQLQDMPVTVIAQSGTIDMCVKDVLNLQVGDVINLDYDPNSPVQVMVENSPKYYAVPGTHNGKKAISLTGDY